MEVETSYLHYARRDSNPQPMVPKTTDKPTDSLGKDDFSARLDRALTTLSEKDSELASMVKALVEAWPLPAASKAAICALVNRSP